jgi:hypothetical protein
VGEFDNRIESIWDTTLALEEKLKLAPLVQRSYNTLNRENDYWEVEQSHLEEQLFSTRRAYDSNASMFNTLSEADARNAEIVK